MLNEIELKYKDIQQQLYDSWFTNPAAESGVTSSYWKTVGKHTVEKTNDGFQAEGFAFGNFRNRSPIDIAKALPQVFLSRYMLRRCPSFS